MCCDYLLYELYTCARIYANGTRLPSKLEGSFNVHSKYRIFFDIWLLLNSKSFFCYFQVYPIWLCPHRLYKLPMKTMVYPEPGFEQERRQGDTAYAQMYTDVGIYYAPGPVLRGEVFDGAEAVRRMENWLIENHGFQPQYAVSELNEKSFWRMFDASLYEHCRKKFGAVGTFMSVYYKSKKGRKTEKEVQEAEQAHLESGHAEIDQPVD